MFYNKNKCMYMYIKLLLCGGNVQCYIEILKFMSEGNMPVYVSWQWIAHDHNCQNGQPVIKKYWISK